MFKEASRYAEELGFELDLEQLQTIKTDVKKCQVQKLGEEVKNCHSCKFMLICLIEDWRKALDSKKVYLLAMDISKAFDSHHHSLTLAKLKAYGFSDNALDLM